MPVRNALGKQTLTVSSTALKLTVPTGAFGALVTVDDAPVRFWVEDSTPTAAQGHLANPRDQVELTGDELRNFRVIRQGASDAVLQITYGAYLD